MVRYIDLDPIFYIWIFNIPSTQHITEANFLPMCFWTFYQTPNLNVSGIFSTISILVHVYFLPSIINKLTSSKVIKHTDIALWFTPEVWKETCKNQNTIIQIYIKRIRLTFVLVNILILSWKIIIHNLKEKRFNWTVVSWL